MSSMEEELSEQQQLQAAWPDILSKLPLKVALDSSSRPFPKAGGYHITLVMKQRPRNSLGQIHRALTLLSTSDLIVGDAT